MRACILIFNAAPDPDTATGIYNSGQRWPWIYPTSAYYLFLLRPIGSLVYYTGTRIYHVR